MTTKRRKRHSPEQIVRKLRDADAMLNAGKDEAAVLQALEVSQSTYDRWQKQYGGMKAEEARRLKELEEENKKLKEIVAEKELDIKMLRHVAQGNCRALHCPRMNAGPSRKRTAVQDLQEEFEVSELRACEVVDQPRSTQRYEAQPRDDEAGLTSGSSNLK